MYASLSVNVYVYVYIYIYIYIHILKQTKNGRLPFELKRCARVFLQGILTEGRMEKVLARGSHRSGGRLTR